MSLTQGSSTASRETGKPKSQRPFCLDQPLECIYHASFDDPARELDIMARMPGLEEYEAQRRNMRIPKDAPAELASLYEMPLLNKEQEQQNRDQTPFTTRLIWHRDTDVSGTRIGGRG